MKLSICGVLEVETFGLMACYIRLFSCDCWIEHRRFSDPKRPLSWKEMIGGYKVIAGCCKR